MRDSMLKGKWTYPFMVRPLRCAPRAACIDKSEQCFLRMLRCMIKLGSLSSDTQSGTALFYLSSRCMNWCAFINGGKTMKRQWSNISILDGFLQLQLLRNFNLELADIVDLSFIEVLGIFSEILKHFSLSPKPQKKPSSKQLVTSKSEKLPWQVNKGMLREAVSCFVGNQVWIKTFCLEGDVDPDFVNIELDVVKALMRKWRS